MKVMTQDYRYRGLKLRAGKAPRGLSDEELARFERVGLVSDKRRKSSAPDKAKADVPETPETEGQD